MRKRKKDTVSKDDVFEMEFINHSGAGRCVFSEKTLKEQGTAIFTWTIRSPEAEAIAMQTVDNITFEGYLAAHP